MTASPVSAATNPLLRMVAVTKSYPGVRALDGVDFDLAAGEVHALLGENGAGKSTLIKVLAGVHQPDGGRLELDGRPVVLRSPADATRAGIAVVHQELVLIPTLTVRENLFLGRARTRRGLVHHREERERARALFARLGFALDPEARVRDLSVADQQLVEIARALDLDARVLILDEPTSSLSPSEAASLLDVLADLAARGMGVIYISHRLEEIERIADRVTVLRDGARVPSGATRGEWIEAMVGRPLDQEYPARRSHAGDVRLEVRGLSRPPAVQDVDFDLRAGEVLGLTGLVGAGRTELARLICGADRAARGSVRLDGQPVDLSSPRTTIRAGIGYLSEDRKGEGLLLDRSLRENFALANDATLTRRGRLLRALEAARFRHHADALRMKYTEAEQPARGLSGGNQQKLVLARWLQRDAEVLILDEPTRGIDVGARYEIYVLIRELAARGKSLLVISSDLPEVLGICDRVLVLHEGRLTADLAVDGLTQEQLLTAALGQGAVA